MDRVEHSGRARAPGAGKAAASAPKPTVFFLYIPGGGVLGQIPLAVLERLESLTGRFTAELFQASQGVSTGSIAIAGLNIRDPQNPNRPKFSAREGRIRMRDRAPDFFPPKPSRTKKMLTANIINGIEAQINPKKYDALLLRYIGKQCDLLREKLAPEHHTILDNLLTSACKTWFTEKDKMRVLKLNGGLIRAYSSLEDEIGLIGELVSNRMTTGRLSSVFTRAALRSMEFIKRTWAKPEDYLFDPSIPSSTYGEAFEGARISDSMHSVYISAYDVQNHRVVTCYSRKKNFFDTSLDAEAETSSHNYSMRDAVMASTSNPFAYPPYRMEDGTIATDKAPLHSPLPGILNVWRNKPQDYDIKVVILGTGQFLSSNLNGEALIEYYKSFGIAGNLMSGHELAEIEGYVMSQFRAALRELLPPENIIEISPRLAPRTDDEFRSMPSRDILNASPENQARIDETIRRLLIKRDRQIRELAQMLTENLYIAGRMKLDEYADICRRIGVKEPGACLARQAEPPKLPDNVSEDGTDMINRLWRRLVPAWWKSANANGNGVSGRKPPAAPESDPIPPPCGQCPARKPDVSPDQPMLPFPKV